MSISRYSVKGIIPKIPSDIYNIHNNVLNLANNNWVGFNGIYKTFSISFEKKKMLAHTNII